MNPSPELKDLVLRSYDAFASGDAAFFDRFFSQREGVLYIGTDPQEWWTGYDTIARIFRAQWQELGGVSLVGGDPQAYSDGTIGWVADRPTFRLPDGLEIPTRSTIVFAREDGAWKAVQMHVSIGVPNQDAVGQELPV
jgi:hypothetical protein